MATSDPAAAIFKNVRRFIMMSFDLAVILKLRAHADAVES
jgi:hypothetical protein